jgi:hypothetical protein
MLAQISDTDAESDIKPRIRGAKSRKKSIVVSSCVMDCALTLLTHT